MDNNNLNNNLINNNRGKENWISIVVLIGIAAYFHWLVIGLHIETSRLSEEREIIQAKLEIQRNEIVRFQSNFNADIQEATKNLQIIFKDAKDDF